MPDRRSGTSTYRGTPGPVIQLILLDYWSVWLGGRYADAEGPAYVDAVASVTDRVNTVIKTTAADTNSGYVDLRAIFKGPDYDSDETPYLASDGDHPNAAWTSKDCRRRGRLGQPDAPMSGALARHTLRTLQRQSSSGARWRSTLSMRWAL